jgi:hypothetical protein
MHGYPSAGCVLSHPRRPNRHFFSRFKPSRFLHAGHFLRARREHRRTNDTGPDRALRNVV